MRHRIYGKHLGRDKGQRDNLFKGLLASLFTHGTIQTSTAKAKAIKGLIDKVINLAKDRKAQTQLQSFLTDKNLRERLIKEIVPKLGKRNSGYTSLVRLGTRLGDQTMMVSLSLIGAEELKPMEKVTGDSGQVTVRKTTAVKKVKTTTLSKKPTTRKPARKRVAK